MAFLHLLGDELEAALAAAAFAEESEFETARALSPGPGARRPRSLRR